MNHGLAVNHTSGLVQISTSKIKSADRHPLAENQEVRSTDSSKPRSQYNVMVGLSTSAVGCPNEFRGSLRAAAITARPEHDNLPAARRSDYT